MSSDGIREIGVGMLGYAFMGKAHSQRLPQDRLHDVAAAAQAAARGDRGRGTRRRSARRRRATASSAGRRTWEDLVADPGIGLFDNLGPNSLHAAPTIAAAEAGKHVVCEKPLGRDADESYEIWRRVAATGVKHMCAFNYRFVPAVRLARELIEAGELGEIRHFRGRYLQDWGDTTAEVWRFDRAAAGSGALGDLAPHVVDLARYLVGEIDEVGGFCSTFIPQREVDDAVEATVVFANGAVGTLEATRLALGRRNAFQWEINGTEGSLAFDMERLNELQVFRAGDERTRGFKTVLVSEATIRSGSTGGRRVTSSAGATPSSTSSTTSWPRSPGIPTSPRTGRRSRTATGPPRSAMRSCAPARADGARRSTYRTLCTTSIDLRADS